MSHTGCDCEPDYTQNPEYAIAALLHMLVRYPMVDCDTMAGSIAAHLRIIADDARFSEVVRRVAAQSRSEWVAMMAMRAELARQRQFPN